jgi:hypothetical protein
VHSGHGHSGSTLVVAPAPSKCPAMACWHGVLAIHEKRRDI